MSAARHLKQLATLAPASRAQVRALLLALLVQKYKC
jgi:hypothetical protein